MNRKLFTLFVFTAVVVSLLAACSPQSAPSKAELPVDKGYAEGSTIYFTHTEASNDAIAQKMAAGMKSPVLYAPSLAKVPAEALANVYVFTNGVKGETMSGLQPSVFDNPPGTERYTPLRRLNPVTWVDETKAHELKSAADVLAAADAGHIIIKQPGVVINMPFAVWDGGQR